MLILISILVLVIVGCKESTISKEIAEDLAKEVVVTSIVLPEGAKTLRNYSTIEEVKDDLVIDKSIKSDGKWCVNVNFFYLMNGEKVEKIYSILLDLKEAILPEDIRTETIVGNEMIIEDKGTIEIVDNCK